ncbi:hypothetical protein UFOVP23_19 [uncultured Caudovirales phage]|uniref:Uncharacterized protein n=1 Tax=uncultured Caudovirales phage TaxID=2100421 RepID=A0A6J5T7Q4_9CAUD|nr:hypothetical protein UFOVP23_19 [uncultured Caudovirales phage]
MRKFKDNISMAHYKFGRMQQEALNKTLNKMRDMEAIDNQNQPYKQSDKSCVNLFEIYYPAYLEREKKAPIPLHIGEYFA